MPLSDYVLLKDKQNVLAVFQDEDPGLVELLLRCQGLAQHISCVQKNGFLKLNIISQPHLVKGSSNLLG
jgi:hypothetical protein